MPRNSATRARRSEKTRIFIPRNLGLTPSLSHATVFSSYERQLYSLQHTNCAVSQHSQTLEQLSPGILFWLREKTELWLSWLRPILSPSFNGQLRISVKFGGCLSADTNVYSPYFRLTGGLILNEMPLRIEPTRGQIRCILDLR